MTHLWPSVKIYKCDFDSLGVISVSEAEELCSMVSSAWPYEINNRTQYSTILSCTPLKQTEIEEQAEASVPIK